MVEVSLVCRRLTAAVLIKLYKVIVREKRWIPPEMT